jgi:hypothetical protein
MIYVTYFFGGLFVLLGAGMLYIYYRERHLGMFLMAITYAISGLMAITQPHWWPLVAGFTLAWTLKLMGLEMEVKPPPAEQDASAAKDEAKAVGEEGKPR